MFTYDARMPLVLELNTWEIPDCIVYLKREQWLTDQYYIIIMQEKFFSFSQKYFCT